MKFQDFMDKYGGKGGTKITSKSINKAKKDGISANKLNKFINKAENKNIKTSVPKGHSGAYLTGGGSSSSSDAQGRTATEIDLGVYEAMAGIDTANDHFLAQGAYNNAQIIAGIRSDADKYVADAQAGASMYASDASVDIAGITSSAEERWRKYLADQQRLGAENVATIQGEYSLSLQNIVTAGLKDVEKIRGEFGLESDKVRGEYALEGERIKGDAARDVASRQKDAQIFGSLMSGFWS
jgi:hypothetical protein|tara:strand:- start:2269 stop:2988 length:720 start_codon:yes stop_codon:yes gene_type:complete